MYATTPFAGRVLTLLIAVSLAPHAHADRNRGLRGQVHALQGEIAQQAVHDAALIDAVAAQVKSTTAVIAALCVDGARLALCPDPLTRTVFVTSTLHSGNLPGTGAADLYCNVRAQNAGLGGDYRAWISDSDSTDPESTFTRAEVPYALPDGTIVARDWDDLVDGHLEHAINRDEYGQALPFSEVGTSLGVWTGTDAAGEHVSFASSLGPQGADCDNWFSTAAGVSTDDGALSLGAAGRLNRSDAAWSFDTSSAGPAGFLKLRCSNERRLYCFEQ